MSVKIAQLVIELRRRGVAPVLVDDTLDIPNRVSGEDLDVIGRHGALIREYLLAEQRARLAELGRAEPREPDATHLSFAAWLHEHGRMDG